jgi:hypothetical protein
MIARILASVTRNLLGLMTIALGLGLGLGWWLYAGSKPQEILRFEAPVIDLRGSPAIEGERIEVVATLRNDGAFPVHITNIGACCGARAIGAGHGAALPSDLASGATVPLTVTIDTMSVSGEKLAQVKVEGETPDSKNIAPAELTLSYYVESPLVITPDYSWITLRQDELSSPVTQTILLADFWPDDGLRIKSITSTLGDKLHYQLVPVRGEAWFGARLLHKRYDLELSLTLDSAKPSFEHVITITPDHPKAKPVEFHLVGKIVPRCGLDVDSLSFCGTRPGEHLVRRIEYHYQDPSDQDIRPVKSPAWLKVSIAEERNGVKLLTLDCCLPECKGPRMEDACFEFGRDKQRSVLSLFVSCSGGGDTARGQSASQSSGETSKSPAAGRSP